jgi:hypothetical protein
MSALLARFYPLWLRKHVRDLNIVAFRRYPDTRGNVAATDWQGGITFSNQSQHETHAAIGPSLTAQANGHSKLARRIDRKEPPHASPLY